MANEMRLIDADELILAIHQSDEELHSSIWETDEIVDEIRRSPTVDAVPVKCKIGEWVYALWEAPVKQKYIIYCAEVKEIRIGIRNCRLTTTYRLEPIMYRGHIHEYRGEDFGKLVFPSENEAEAALAKIDGGDGDG